MKKLANTRKLTRLGSSRSIGVVLPADLVRQLGWKEHQRVVIKKVSGALVVRDWKKRK
jgi:antitoxin component of MazEF toxin-antitoxin module